MQQEVFQYSNDTTTIVFDGNLENLKSIAPPDNSFIITDENLMLHYADAFKPWRTIVLPPGESSKNLESIDDIVRQLIALEAGRDACIIGIGGGVITDIAGFAAGIYKRGVRCVLVPTSVLAMVDASIGGKNGIDIGEYKNMMGLIRQPDFLFYNFSYLQTLPKEEWINGFAEIIKHACIKDDKMFYELSQKNIDTYREEVRLMQDLVKRNFKIKNDVVLKDEFEKGDRKLLNFGHTFGHAIENIYQLPHGHAVAIGMVVACKISEKLCAFSHTDKVIELINRYQLPDTIEFDINQVLHIMLADKKRTSDTMQYVLLEDIGKGIVKNIAIKDLPILLKDIV